MTPHNKVETFCTTRLILPPNSSSKENPMETDSIPKDFIQTIKNEHKYQFIKKLGKGGMGDVTLAKDTICLRSVAIKKLHKDLSKSDESIMRFTEEAQITAQLEHPNIISIYDIGLDLEGSPYYSMKHIEGHDLRTILTEVNRSNEVYLDKYPITELIKILIKICDAMSFACSKGALHRDLKPENIMIGEFGEVLLVDWGLAKAIDPSEKGSKDNDIEKFILENTQINTLRKRTKLNLSLDNCLIGTPEYMAPERIFGYADERSEVYSLGAILYALLTLENIYKEEDVKTLIRKVTKGHYRELKTFSKLPHFANKKIPDSLISIAEKALENDPNHRYQKVSHLKKDLEAYLQGYAPEAEDAKISKVFKLMLLRHKKLSFTIASLMFILLFFSIVFINKLILQKSHAEIESKLAIQLERQAQKKAVQIERQSTDLNHKINEIKLSAPIFYENTQNQINELNFKKAAASLDYALVLQPNMTKALILKARLQMLDFKFNSALRIFQNVSTSELLQVKLQKDIEMCELARKELNRKSESDIAVMLFNYFIQFQRSAEAIRLLKRLKTTANYDQYLFRAWQAKLIQSPIKDIIQNPELFTMSVHKGLFTVYCRSQDLYDLSPFKGMPITKLTLIDTKIDNILQLRNMPISSLTINNCELDSLVPFKNKTLTELDISNTKVSTLFLVGNMPIRKLNISGTPIANLSHIANMPLKEIDISNTTINLLKALNNKQLTHFKAENCQLTDIDALAKMPLIVLNLKKTPLKKAHILASFPKLKYLNIDSTFIDSLKALRNNTSLISLSINSCPIRSLDGLQNCQLTYLAASHSSINSLNELQGQAIKKAYLNHTQIEDISPLANKSLTFLSLSHCPFLKTETLSNCTELKELTINEGNIKNLSFLNKINLRIFRASYNQIRDIRGLAHMSQLEILNLNKNPLQDISPLKDTSLRELSLSLTSVKDLTPLRELPLERLSLSDCKQITSLEPLKDLVTLKALKVPARRKDYQFLKELKHLDELSDNWRTMKPHKFWEKYSLIIKD